jgi:hypothetical protein
MEIRMKQPPIVPQQRTAGFPGLSRKMAIIQSFVLMWNITVAYNHVSVPANERCKRRLVALDDKALRSLQIWFRGSGSDLLCSPPQHKSRVCL